MPEKESRMNKWRKLSWFTLMLVALTTPLWSAIIAPLPVTLQNGTTADANQVMSNFNQIVNNVNSNAAPLATSAQTNVTNTFTSPQIMSAATALNHAVIASQVQQNGLTYFTDTGAANAYVVTPAPVWASYSAGSELYVKIGAGNTSTGASTINVSALGLKNILNEDSSTLEANALLTGQVYHLIYDGTQFEIIGKNNTAPTPATADNSTKVATTAYVYLAVPAGTVLDYAGSSTPAGFLLCDGTAYSRTVTYAALFTAIGTTWGAGDGSTTFNVPNFNGRVTIGSGTAVVSETQTTNVAANAQVVTSNTAKWITAQTVRVSSSGTLPTGLSINTDYFIVRVDATHVSFATTLANSQNASVITITGGTGNITITTAGASAQSYQTHALAEQGGEEGHAISSAEQLAHTHTDSGHSHGPGSYTTSPWGTPTGALQFANTANNLLAGTAVPVTGTSGTGSAVISATGGNVAGNTMQTYATVRKIIKY
jgi:microcystin-dependent protein